MASNLHQYRLLQEDLGDCFLEARAVLRFYILSDR